MIFCDLFLEFSRDQTLVRAVELTPSFKHSSRVNEEEVEARGNEARGEEEKGGGGRKK